MHTIIFPNNISRKVPLNKIMCCIPTTINIINRISVMRITDPQPSAFQNYLHNIEVYIYIYLLTLNVKINIWPAHVPSIFYFIWNVYWQLMNSISHYALHDILEDWMSEIPNLIWKPALFSKSNLSGLTLKIKRISSCPYKRKSEWHLASTFTLPTFTAFTF